MKLVVCTVMLAGLLATLAGCVHTEQTTPGKQLVLKSGDKMIEKNVQGLTEIKLVQGKSMDEIDNESFGAGPSPLDSENLTITLLEGAAAHPKEMPLLQLDGEWLMADNESFRDAIPASVPGSVHTALLTAGRIPDPTFARNQLLAAKESYKTWWFKRTFKRPVMQGESLVFDGVCYICTVWLNGNKLGEWTDGVKLGYHEGMFGGPSFEIARYLHDENTLIVKLEPIPHILSELVGTSNSCYPRLVVFNNVYGWHYSQCPALGIWRSVHIDGAPTVKMDHPFMATHNTENGTMDLVIPFNRYSETWSGTLAGTVLPDNFEDATHHFSIEVKSGKAQKELHLRFSIPHPQLWWPNDLGAQNLYRMTLSFIPDNGGQPDTRSFTFGIRTIEMRPLPGGPYPEKFNWTFVINGKPAFVKGTGWCTLDPLMDFRRERYEHFLQLAKDQHCQMVRAWGCGMPETDDFYDLCDRLGIMVMQEWPTSWNSHNTQPYDVLEETVRLNTFRIRNRASLAMYVGGNESGKPFGRAIDMMGRLAIELDGTRPFHRGEPWGGSIHNYASWWGRQSLDAHVRQEADFFGEFGMASAPLFESVQRYLPENEKNLWPPLNGGSFEYHTPTFSPTDVSRLTQFAQYFVPKGSSLEMITIGSQLAQVTGLRHQLERARTRWPYCTGALYYKLNDNFPAVSWATADWYGAPKIAHYFCQDVFAPLHACVVFESVNNVATHLSLPVFLLDDANALKSCKWQVQVRAYDGQLREIKRTVFDGKEKIESPKRLGNFELSFEQTDTVPLLLVTEVIKNEVLADRTFYWVNYEPVKGCLFTLPHTTLNMKVQGNSVTVTNTGSLPAVAVHITRPGHLDTFRISDNYFWLDAGESYTVQVSDNNDLKVQAWNSF